MSYSYAEYRPFTLTDEGQRLLLQTRDFAFRMIKQAGCVQADKMLHQMASGSQWDQMAIIDRLIELCELVEVKQADPIAWQYKIFVSPKVD